MAPTQPLSPSRLEFRHVARGVSPTAAGTPVLPRPTGGSPIGVVDLHLIDRSRPDPWNPPQAYRELMVSIVYPARDVAGYERAPPMTPGVSDGFNVLARPGRRASRHKSRRADRHLSHHAGHRERIETKLKFSRENVGAIRR